MKPGFRAVAFAVALTLYALFAVQVWLGQRDPEGFVARPRALAPWIGPSARALNDRAQTLLREAVQVLNDRDRPPAERLAGYQALIERALGLYERSLVARPLQPEALAYVAALRFELAPPSNPADRERLFGMIEHAQRIGYGSADVQFKVGRLRVSMGDRAGALAPIRRAVALEPALARDAAALLADNLFSIDEILTALPERRTALVALEPVYYEESKELELFRALEPLLDEAAPSILSTFANAGLRAGEAARVLDALGAAQLSDPDADAERCLLRARAFRDLGQLEPALAEATRARQMRPENSRYAEYLGQTAAAAGDADRAIAAYRDSLALLARIDSDPSLRARLYREIGQAEESRRRPDRAYDAYRRAIEIDPTETIAARRLREMSRAGGFDGR